MSSHLSEFFSSKTILITGSTGFVGKCLLEKILRSCPSIERIYVLLRPKSGKSSKKRLKELFSSEVFELISRENPQQLEKVIALSGDVTYDELALSPTQRQLIVENVNFIFNCAASIRFDEPLRRALQLNVGSTLKLIQLAEKCLKLQALVHVSTAYCTRDKSLVKEEIPLESYSPKRLLDACEWMSDEMLEDLSKRLLSSRASSYHLSKALAEQLLLEETSIPLAIIRPSIIIGSWREPQEGWIDNYNGLTGFLVATGKGILRSLHCNSNNKCDVIPVDIVVNTVIASVRSVTKGQPFVVNCVSGPLNPVTWEDIRVLSAPALNSYPSMELFRSPHVTLHSSYWIHYCHLVIEHLIPAFVVDMLFRACGLSPILGKVYQKLNRSMTALEEFTRNEWNFESSNYQLLAQQMSFEDNIVFPLNIKDINWKKYFENFQKGIRFYLLKENPKTISLAKNKLKNLQFWTQTTKLLVFSLLLYGIQRKRKIIRF